MGNNHALSAATEAGNAPINVCARILAIHPALSREVVDNSQERMRVLMLCPSQPGILDCRLTIRLEAHLPTASFTTCRPPTPSLLEGLTAIRFRQS